MLLCKQAVRAPIHHAIDIEASPAAVWAVFTNFDLWPRWFPYAASARSVGGPTWQRGGALEVRLVVPVVGALTLRLEVAEAEAERRVRWIGGSWGVRGDHLYTFEDRGGWTRVTSHEEFGGPFAFAAGARLRDRVDQLAHASMGHLKALVEERRGA